MGGAIRVGISGWNYASWRGAFYPRGLKRADELRYAATRFSTIEINGSFYSLKRPEHYRSWSAATPDDFLFSVKGGRYITHMKRLREVEEALANFFASGVLCLGTKLGPLLWQFPPTFAYDPNRFDEFFDLLPKNTRDAQSLAGRHAPWLAGRVSLDVDSNRLLRHAVEVRHPSFAAPGFTELLRRYGLALVVADTAGHHPQFETLTADFVYVRLHGQDVLYAGGYDRSTLRRWAERIASWHVDGVPWNAAPPTLRDVFVYFDNDAKVRAPFDAVALEEVLGERATVAPHLIRGIAGHS